MSKKDHNLTLAERLKRLFVGAKETAPVEIKPATMPAAHHTADDMAFKAGAAVTFVTPIGTYAGNTSAQRLRSQAEQQFHHMDSSRNTTIN